MTKHPSIWTVIEAFRKDQALAATTMLQDQIGERPQKRVRRAQKTFEDRLVNLCSDRQSSSKSVEEFLQGLDDYAGSI
ncbi:putative Inosine-5'-monophosphate dehydrogenase 1b-like 9 [Homarus americanus]|uniref:Putative Inosine-5'-monophosphate dehydrogenase 1b-like 9 n=1 Tax=Homarus americanus TaxID=6706 RepID=A0A8J5MMD9_HOMAM|nr:putative Inosine-5'-monophosphate dehydrogenase 1b-like 9 [Homarus americanus]